MDDAPPTATFGLSNVTLFMSEPLLGLSALVLRKATMLSYTIIHML